MPWRRAGARRRRQIRRMLLVLVGSAVAIAITSAGAVMALHHDSVALDLPEQSQG